jgi:hypothetical protein
LREYQVVSGQTFLSGDVIGHRINELCGRFVDLGYLQAVGRSERTILAVAIFFCCTAVIRCIRTAFY